ncbi:MAG: GNAT family N-acetyltransferase [Chloroflexi bacterium]|nr:GNAT family N-acetyltransferase [Chloroflexota bacterium]
MIARLVAEPRTAAHIRPFNPARDLADLATLIELAFGPELKATGSRMVEEMRQAALWGPALNLANALVPLFTGFVWVEGGCLIGNVSLTREEGQGVWVLSNVAVLPEHRGRGIAGQLVDRAIAQLRAQGTRRVVLQVRADNDIAIALYRHRGFARYDTVYEMRLAGSHWVTPIGRTAQVFRAVRPSDGTALYRLVQASTPDACQSVRPLRPADYRRGLWWQCCELLGTAFSARQRLEMVAEQDGEIVAFGRVTARLFSGPHELELHVLPAARGDWEALFIDALLGIIPRTPRWQVRATLSASHPEAVRALQQLGFETQRVLDQMLLEL